ncbi:hypothetical protein BGZ73_002203 [Actinomortierella ambigua]|nr:hypothetical protein BGZ73_002203 [Actinomortierella ambigua]
MLGIQQVCDIPELRCLIVQLLDLDGRRACALVNRAFHRDIQPFVWESFSVPYPYDTTPQAPSEDQCPVAGSFVSKTEEQEQEQEHRLASLRKHAHLIRHLRRHWPLEGSQLTLEKDMQVFLKHCRSLLSFEASTSRENQWDWENCKELVRLNPGLRSVEMWGGMKWATIDARLHDVACYSLCGEAGLNSLRQLTLGCDTMVMPLAKLVDVCPALEDLTIGGIIPPDITDWAQRLIRKTERTDRGDEKSRRDFFMPPCPPSATVIPWGLSGTFCLKKLHFQKPCQSQDLATFLKLCPLLDTLILDDMPVLVRQKVCEVLRDGYLPNLTSIALGSGEEDQELNREVLEALPMHQIENLHFQDMTAQDIEFLVERQHKSLKDMHLDLWYRLIEQDDDENGVVHFLAPVDPDIGYNFGSAVCNILASCPQLCELTIETGPCKTLDIRHLIARPWVCKKMRALEIPVSLPRTCQDPRLLRHAQAEKRQAAAEGKLARRPPSPSSSPLQTHTQTQNDKHQPQSVENLEEWEQCEVVWMKYLSQLDQLHLLNLEKEDVSLSIKPESLTWTMDLGLGYLKTLTLLETLVFPTSPYMQGVPEWEFMKQHWPKLCAVKGPMPIKSHLGSWSSENWPELKVREE